MEKPRSTPSAPNLDANSTHRKPGGFLTSWLAPARTWLGSLKISQKISLGYAVALGIAISGTAAGIALGDRHQNLARKQIEDVLEETRLLAILDRELSHAILHQHRIIIFGGKPKKFQEEYAEFQYHAAGFDRAWQELKATYVSPEIDERSDELELVKKLAKKYDGLTAAYFHEVEFILSDLDPNNWRPEEVEEDQQRLIRLNQNALGRSMKNFSEDLENLGEAIAQETEDAEEYLQQAEALQIKAIALSIVLSVAIAGLFAIRTSRTISLPLRKVTYIAHKATAEANFDLQAPVTTQDEVGILALAINQLIGRVQQLLKDQQHANEKLEHYNQTLEQRVQERTQELHDKNEFLQDTLRKLQRTQAQLIQAEKMSSLGQMVAGVAHEINNPVNFIFGNLTHAKEYLEDILNLLHLYEQEYPTPTPAIQTEIEAIELDFLEEDLLKLFGSMRVGADRIQEIVKSLRNFSRLDEAEIKTVDIHEGIDGTLMILQNRLKAKPEYPAIEIVKKYGTLPQIDCYPGPLNQVFMNLLANAIDALEHKRLDRRETARIEIHTEAIGDRISIRIRDNGTGIPNSIRSKLFDPFFTTKPVGKGTGLGLSISYQIVVDKHDGSLQCRSNPSEGTEFAIELPVRQAAIQAA